MTWSQHGVLAQQHWQESGIKGLYQTIGNGPGIFVICAGLSQFVELVTGRKKARMHFCNPG